MKYRCHKFNYGINDAYKIIEFERSKKYGPKFALSLEINMKHEKLSNIQIFNHSADRDKRIYTGAGNIKHIKLRRKFESKLSFHKFGCPK